jgi:iron complex transport system substrate-binding protein
MVNMLSKSFYNKSLYWLGVFLLGYAFACSNNSDQKNSETNSSKQANFGKSSINHAVGFDVVNYDEFKIIQLFSHYNDSSDTLKYLLKSKEEEVPAEFQNYTQITTPVKRIALLHSSYISYFNFCEAIENLSSISEVKYVFDKDVFSAVDNGELPEVGYGESLDREKLLALETELVITVGFPNAPNKSEQVLKELGIPVLVFSDWQEATLMGRLEWVKVVAALTGKDEGTAIRFQEIEKQYSELVSISKKATSRPTILCNLPYKGSWFVPGGNSYVSNLILDAGGTYLWADDEGTGAIQLDFESVYAKGLNAEYLINPDFAFSSTDILDKDERLADFKSFKEQKIFNNNKLISRGIANDYFESGIINPHVILADMIKILHPQLLQDHQLHYYHQLN